HSAAALAAQDDNSAMTSPASGMPSGGGMPGRGGAGGIMGGATSTAGGVANTAGGAIDRTAGSVAGTTSAGGSVGGHLGASSRGVVNMPGLSLAASASNSTQGSVITSDKKNVKLDSGTEMVLKVNR
ncbi:MAG TPA: hypothetical protein VH744_03505, partial [Terriglobales bacterium]